MKRVALFLPHVSDGGAERVLLSLGAHWAEHRVDVHLLVACTISAGAPAISPAIRVVEGGAASTPRFLPTLVRELRRLRPSGVLAALPHGNFVASSAHGIARSPSRLVLSDHCPLGARRGALRQVAMRTAYRRADAVVAVSSGVASDLRTAYGLDPSQVHVIKNPVLAADFEARSQESLPSSFTWEAPSAPRGARLVSVGRLTALKDVATCLRAFAEVRKARPARLAVLGQGEERAALMRLAQELGVAEDVSFVGFVENPLPFMKSADVLVHTSRLEGLGNILVEALACGTHVVATDCPHGPRQVIEELGSGTLVPVGDAGAVANAIEGALRAASPAEPSPAALAHYALSHVAQSYGTLLF